MQKISIVVDDQGKVFKTCVDENYLFRKWPQANLNRNPKLNPRVMVGVNSWEKG